MDNLEEYSFTIIESDKGVKLNFARVGKIVIFTVDTNQLTLDRGYSVAIPNGYEMKTLDDLIVSGTQDSTGSTVGSIRFSRRLIRVQQTLAVGTLLNAIWTTY